MTTHANDTEHCRRRVGQSCGNPGLGRAFNLVGKDGKDAIAGYERNEIVKLRFVWQDDRVRQCRVMLREGVAHWWLNCTGCQHENAVGEPVSPLRAILYLFLK